MAREYDSPTGQTDPRALAGRGRETDENPLFRWFMIDGSRWGIVVGLSVGIFLVLVGLGALGVIGVGRSSLVTGVFGASITGVFTLVSITITINQLVLSRILGSPGMIEERIASVRAFRTEVQEMVEPVAVSPTDPAAFMELVTHSLSDRIARLQAVYRDDHESDQCRQVDRLVANLRQIVDDVERGIGGSNADLFHVLSAVLDNKFSRHLNTARRVRAESDDLSTAEENALDDLVEALTEINRTRHYFKTLYLHGEIANLSRVMLISGLPALVASFATVLLYDGMAAQVGPFPLLLIVSGGMTVVLLPLVILLSFSLRFITIAKRTTTFGSFTPPEELP